MLLNLLKFPRTAPIATYLWFKMSIVPRLRNLPCRIKTPLLTVATSLMRPLQ